MYEVLDLFYTEDECQSCFTGTFEECEEFIKKQGGASFMYKIAFIVKPNTKRIVEILIERLNEMGINTTLHKMFGVYIIELDKTGYKRKELDNILNIMNDRMSLVHYSQISDCLCLNTNVNIK